jgi:hypothetical protein
MDNTQELIDKLTNAISFKFKEDATSPGLTISRLKRNTYYCSVVRYPNGSKSVGSKVIVCKSEDTTLAGAVAKIAVLFVKTLDAQPDPLQTLAEATRTINLPSPY